MEVTGADRRRLQAPENTMLKQSLLVATAVFAGAFTTMQASAAPAVPVRGAVMFWLLDRNDNGAIEKAEIDALRTVIFDAVDANQDGKVTEDELTATVETMRRVRPMRHDGEAAPARRQPVADRLAERLGIGPDGLSKNEFMAREAKLFVRIDTNGDGSLSQAEFANAKAPLGRLMMD
jgi:Ca2+-binding EF-hand superfamily protein